MSNYVDPLEGALWFERIELIASGSLGLVENSLRHAAHLLALTPRILRPAVGLAIDLETFENLLDRGEFDEAARCLIAQPIALNVVNEQRPDVIRARINCSVLGRKIEATGATVATAVINAWTSCLLSLRTEFGENLSGLTPHSVEKSSTTQSFEPMIRTRPPLH